MDSAAFLSDKSHQIKHQMLLLTSSVEEALVAEDSFISPTRREISGGNIGMLAAEIALIG